MVSIEAKYFEICSQYIIAGALHFLASQKYKTKQHFHYSFLDGPEYWKFCVVNDVNEWGGSIFNVIGRRGTLVLKVVDPDPFPSVSELSYVLRFVVMFH